MSGLKFSRRIGRAVKKGSERLSGTTSPDVRVLVCICTADSADSAESRLRRRKPRGCRRRSVPYGPPDPIVLM